VLNVLASGTLIADPVARTSAKGKPFATGTMRVPSEDADPVLMSLIAFSSTAVDTLLALTKGDALAVVGRAKLTSWTKDGEDRHGLSMVADQVMSVYQADKRRKRAAAPEEVTA
jgi:single-stranded DNA-binding protein